MILVTGGSGLLGQHLLKALLKDGEMIRATYLHTDPPAALSQGIEWMRCDLEEYEDIEAALQGVTHVYHCAAMVSYDRRLHERMMRVNIEGTANLVNACLDRGIQKLVHVSSIAAFSQVEAPELVNETTPWLRSKEDSAYAQSKHKSEMEVWRGIAEGLNAVIVNPSIILGEGDWNKGSAALFRIVKNEFPWYTGGATGWVDVQDVVRAMTGLMKSDIAGERFILNGGNHPYRDVFTWMAEAMGVRPPHREARPWMAELVWRWAYLKSMLTGKEATLTKETARSAQRISAYDGSKICGVLKGFEYTGVKETVKRVGDVLSV
ncbi:MAG: NAD-dependent epimerase/dehydratase family protein [Chitinophagaceae bacterium]|nr:NAD-dependent epimerase/dehydratase family protein [Chitinophagaceae bacterium]